MFAFNCTTSEDVDSLVENILIKLNSRGDFDEELVSNGSKLGRINLLVLREDKSLDTSGNTTSNKFSLDSYVSRRSFSTTFRKLSNDYTGNDMFTLLSNTINSPDFKVNHEGQEIIERVLHGFSLNENTKNSGSLVYGLKLSMLSGKTADVLQSKDDMIKQYIDKLLSHVKDVTIRNITSKVGYDGLYSICIYHLLKILTHTGTDNEDKFGSTSVTISMGKDLFNKYLNIEKDKSKTKLRYREWLIVFKSENKVISDIMDGNINTFYLQLGAKLVDILLACNLIYIEVVPGGKSEKKAHFIIKDEDLKGSMGESKIVATPLNLPMIVEPNEFSESKIGGFLLNDKSYAQEIFTDNHSFKEKSVINNNDNKLYYLVNGTGKTPFEINQEVLEFLKTEVGRTLLINDNDLHAYSSEGKLSKYKQKKIKALKSKLVLQ